MKELPLFELVWELCQKPYQYSTEPEKEIDSPKEKGLYKSLFLLYNIFKRKENYE
jgi:hypothetical protein